MVSSDDAVEIDGGSPGDEPAVLKSTLDDNAVEIDGGSLGDEPKELGNTPDDINAVNEINDTFTDLNNEINVSVGTFEIEHNYKFNNKTDNSPVVINKDNFVINGNNHILDGSNQSTIFHINGTNITINNLVFVNGNNVHGSLLVNDGGGALKITAGGVVTLNNVTFINNTANYMGGDIFVDYTHATYLNCIDCKFIDSHAYKGNSIYAQMTVIIVRNSSFTSKYSNNWATVYGEGSPTGIYDCIFNGISSKYSPAVFVEEATQLFINNTEFYNLRASENAGSVGAKSCKGVRIENCVFENTSSVKNGGAIFVDIAGEARNVGLATIFNVTCINASSGFGGAYLQLGGNLTLEGSNFINCSAEFDGGAVYLSNVIANITDVTFDSNKVVSQIDYPTSGGAVYFDYGILNMTDCEFSGNDASIAGAILIYDSKYYLDNILLNGNGNAVFTYFDNENSTIGMTYGTDKIYSDDLNNTYYPSVVIREGMALNLTTNTMDLSILPIRFDLREIGWITPVEDQGRSGSCWAFGAFDAVESALVKNTGTAYQFSENNMRDSMLIYSRYGRNAVEASNELNAAGYLLSWFGALPSEYDTYDELGKISPLLYTSQNIHIQDVAITARNLSIQGADPALKKAIIKYGALAILFCADQSPKGYNPNTSAFYSVDGDPDHSVGLVGWDDNFSRYNFATVPEGDGAWIIKNSWGTEWGDEGYGYVSYYDKSLCISNYVSNEAVGYIIENTLSYNKNYQYDFLGLMDFAFNDPGEFYGVPITEKSTFISVDDDLIAAVGTYFNQSGVDYTIEIEVNGNVVYTQSGISQYCGYQTIKLDKYIPIKWGDKFSVYVTAIALGISEALRIHYKDGVSMMYFNGSWVDSYKNYSAVVCIKAYTLEDDTVITGNKNIVVNHDDESYFSVKVVTADGHVVGAGEKVKFTINGKTTTATTDKDGTAKIKISLVPNKYQITTTYNGKSVKNTVTVKKTTPKIVASAKAFKVKDKTKKYVLTLKTNKNKALKNAMVYIKVNGKTYSAKTNSKGQATFKLTKLSKVGSFNAGITFKGNAYYNKVYKTVKITVKK
jgi:C1A family cysteine protease